MNTLRRGSVSLPNSLPPNLTELKLLQEEKCLGLKSLSDKINELESKLHELENRKVHKCVCKCDAVESKLSKEIKQLTKQIKDLIEL